MHANIPLFVLSDLESVAYGYIGSARYIIPAASVPPMYHLHPGNSITMRFIPSGM